MAEFYPLLFESSDMIPNNLLTFDHLRCGIFPSIPESSSIPIPVEKTLERLLEDMSLRNHIIQYPTFTSDNVNIEQFDYFKVWW